MAALLGLVGCEEPPPPAPLDFTGDRISVTEQPSELTVNPHARMRERTDEERSREAERMGLTAGSADRAVAHQRSGVGGGGGGNDPWHPHPADPPTRAELERYQRELDEQMQREVDPSHEACRQLTDSLRASVGASEAATHDRVAPLDAASRRQLEAMCGTMPAGYQRCMDHEYFRQHLDECQRELARVGRRGERRRDEARAQLDAIRRGDAPLPDNLPHDEGEED